MTTEIEKQFFDTFGIEPREFKSCDVGTFCPYPEKKCGTDICPYYRTYKVDYPAISDRILLELIRLGLNYDFVIHSKSVEELKEKLLALLMYNEAEFKHQVQALFEENNNDR